MMYAVRKDETQEHEDAGYQYKNKKKSKADPEEPTNYYSKNYKRFLEQRTKKIDAFIVSCMGWIHVLRSIEVIEMAMKDLIMKIVPAKEIVRELKSTSGKVIGKYSEYELVERRTIVSVGKKQNIDTNFELDLKEEKPKELEKPKRKSMIRKATLSKKQEEEEAKRIAAEEEAAK